MSEIPGIASSAPPTSAPTGKKRLGLLLFTIAFGIVFGVVAAVFFASWARGLLGGLAALILGLVLAWVLPLFLSVRATLAFRRQNRPILLRRLVSLFLVGLVQVTLFLAGAVQLGASPVSTSGQLAAAAMPIFGALPVLGGILEKTAKDAGALEGTPPVPTADGGPVGPDGGPVAPGDGGVTAPGADGGVATTGPDGGVVAADASGLSPRALGRVVGAVGAVATDTEGNPFAVAWQIHFGGGHTRSVFDLSPFAAKGAPTRVSASVDGAVVVVLGGQQTIIAMPKGKPTAVAELSRGGSVGGLQVQQVQDIAVGPGGAVLAVVDLFDSKTNEVIPALVARPATGAAFIVKKAGDLANPGAPVETNGEPQDRLHAFALKDSDGTGAIVVEEVIRDGDADVGTTMTGTTWTMNPRRLMVGQIDAPRALTEIVKSGEGVSGIENVSLQAFGDAVALPDGRVVFDANFAEDGPRGWLFQARRAGATFAVAPQLVGKPEAPFSDQMPRTPHLSVAPSGHVSFVNKDGAVVLASLDTLGNTQVVLVRADAITSADSKTPGVRLGAIARVDNARLMPGGEWLLASATVLADGGQRRRAVVVASSADLQAGKAEVLLSEGAVVAVGTPPAGTAPEKTIKNLFVLEGHTEALWGTP